MNSVGSIVVDGAVGSKDLVEFPELRGAVVANLDSADVAFYGLNPFDSDETIEVGIEVKSWADFITSGIDKRLTGRGGQLDRMLQRYDHCWLAIYGSYSINANGTIRVDGFTYRSFNKARLDSTLRSIQCAGVKVEYLATKVDLAKWIRRTAEWYWRKGHSLFQGTQQRKVLNRPLRDLAGGEDRVRFIDLVSQLPDVGTVTAIKALEKFGSVAAVLSAEPKDWQEIEGVGKVKAESICAFIHKQLL